jgi:hypothetical protein
MWKEYKNSGFVGVRQFPFFAGRLLMRLHHPSAGHHQAAGLG